MTLKEQVSDYVEFRKALGYVYDKQARILKDYATYAESCGDSFVRSNTVFDWLSKTPSARQQHAKLGYVCDLAAVLHANDERHEVPHRNAMGKSVALRPTPHLLSTDQIRQVMDAALELGPADSITPLTFHYIIGLIAATGLRRSEATNLLITDLTLDGLLIKNAKLGKCRLVPLTDSVRQAMDEYLRARRRMGASDEHLFVLSSGRAVHPEYLTGVFIKLVRRCGLRAGPGEPGPRLHDLRHGFATKSLESVLSNERRDIGRHMLALSTYLGHTNAIGTYWYLEATPVLLQQVSEATERLYQEAEEDD